MTDTQSIESTVHALTRKGFEEASGTPEVTAAPDPTWSAVRAAGTSLWLDTGDIDEAGTLWNAEFEALTTNNTLLNREVQKGLYDDLVGEAASAIRAAAPGIDDRTLLLEIAFILNARHGLTLVQRFGAFVSVELHKRSRRSRGGPGVSPQKSKIGGSSQRRCLDSRASTRARCRLTLRLLVAVSFSHFSWALTAAPVPNPSSSAACRWVRPPCLHSIRAVIGRM